MNRCVFTVQSTRRSGRLRRRPHAPAFLRMIENVIDDSGEMVGVGDGETFAAYGPQTAVGGETVAFHVGAAFLLGDADVMPRVVIRKACQRVEVDAIDGDDAKLDAPFLESADEFLYRALALLATQIYRIALHEFLGALPQHVVLAFWRRIAVVTVNMLAVVSRAEAFGIPGQPRPVGVTQDVKPVVPGLRRDGERFHWIDRSSLMRVGKAQGASTLGFRE